MSQALGYMSELIKNSDNTKGERKRSGQIECSSVTWPSVLERAVSKVIMTKSFLYILERQHCDNDMIHTSCAFLAMKCLITFTVHKLTSVL